MYVVAISELNATPEAEAAALATDLGVTSYEARLLLAPGIPAVVERTADRGRSLDIVARLRGRGHGVVALDASSVVASSAMTSMRRFRLGPSSIARDDGPGELPYGDISALIAAVHRKHTASETEVRERTISIGRAVMTGGLVMTKNTQRDMRTETTEREPVLYVFRRDGAPWLLRERGTTWAGHGRPISPLASENFRTTVSALRERAPDAVYDDRLLTRRSAPERFQASSSAAGTTTTSSSEAGIDLLAHVVALGIAHRRSR